MKLIVKITTKDEKSKEYECVDFPSVGGDFVTLYLKDFRQTMIRTETIERIDRSFNDKKR